MCKLQVAGKKRAHTLVKCSKNGDNSLRNCESFPIWRKLYFCLGYIGFQWLDNLNTVSYQNWIEMKRLKMNSNKWTIIFVFIIFHLVAENISVPRFTKRSWLAFPALRGAYKHIQVTFSFLSVAPIPLFEKYSIIFEFVFLFTAAHRISAGSLWRHCVANWWTWRFDWWFSGRRFESRIHRILVGHISCVIDSIEHPYTIALCNWNDECKN